MSEHFDGPLPRPVGDFRTRLDGHCIRCLMLSTIEQDELIKAFELNTLCEPCRTNWEEKASSYGGTRQEILARVSAWILKAERGQGV